jgi:tripartite ATP-independent transporter DctP family solute receptor
MFMNTMKISRRDFLTVAAAASAAAALSACGASSSAAAPASTAASAAASAGNAAWENYDWKLSTNLAEDHVCCKGYYTMADAIKEATGGKVNITIFPGEQLGKESDVVSSVSMGSGMCEIVIPGTTELAKRDAACSFFDAPYVFDGGEDMIAFANGDKCAALWENIAKESNLRMVGMSYYGIREVCDNGYPATTPAEFAGCKLRVPDSEMALAYGAALGATPTVMSLGEVYMGIQQGVVDGQENPLPTIQANAYYEVCDNLVLTDHVCAPICVTFDDKVWGALPEDLQKVLKDTIVSSCGDICQDVLDLESTLLSKLKDEGMTVIEPDKDAFKANCQSIYDKYADTWGDWFKASQA